MSDVIDDRLSTQWTIDEEGGRRKDEEDEI